LRSSRIFAWGARHSSARQRRPADRRARPALARKASESLLDRVGAAHHIARMSARCSRGMSRPSPTNRRQSEMLDAVERRDIGVAVISPRWSQRGNSPPAHQLFADCDRRSNPHRNDGELGSRANCVICSPAMTVPSSLASSQMTPTGGNPERRQRSTAASVWPERMSTPPSLAIKETHAGRTNRRAMLRWPARARVATLLAEMPVSAGGRHGDREAVPSGASFWRPWAQVQASGSSSVSGAQTMPQQ